MLLLFAVLAISAPLFWARINCPLLEPEEARYAEIPRQMLAQGHWLVPTLHDQAYLDKPPLLYWLVISSYSLFGVHDAAARAVPIAAAWLTIAVVFLWIGRAGGVRAGLLAAGILALSPEFLYRGRMVTMNGLLGLTTTATLAAGWFALAGPRLRLGWWSVAGLACGLGLLTKGPIALALVGPPLALVGWLDSRVRRPGLAAWALFLAVALAVAGPWYVAVAAQEPGFASDFFFTHHVQRYLDSLDHTEPFWFYLPYLVVGSLPWLFLLVPFLRGLRRHDPRMVDRRPAVLGLGVIALAWAVVFLSMADCKRAVYLLPVFPLLAVVLGSAADSLLPRSGWLGPVLSIWAAQAILARRMAVLVLSVTLGAVLVALRTETGVAERLTILTAFLTAALAGTLACRRLRWGMTAALTFAALLIAVHELLPGYHRRFSLRGPVQEQSPNGSATAPRGATTSTAVYCYPRRWDSVSFYLGRDDVRAFAVEERPDLMAQLTARPRSVLFVKTRYLEDVVRDLPPDWEFVATRRTAWVTTGEVRRRDAAEGLASRR